MMTMDFTGTHFGRSWTGHSIEDACPCPKAPCGLVVFGAWDPNCEQHAPERANTVRQTHPAEKCPAVTG